jgi:DNA-binding NarL/FixJ family response regulator
VISVVVVDDHAVVRRGIASLLDAAEDLQCIGTAGDGQSGVAMITRLRPDVVVLDLSMPGQTGVDVIRTLRARGPAVRILVLTSFGDGELVLEAVQAGTDGYLLKENQAETILDGVRAVASGSAPVDPVVATSLLARMREQPISERLTDREQQVLDLVRQGKPNKSIARRLGISEHTVKTHVTHILRRIGATDRTQAALWAQRHLHPLRAPGRET